jgi:diguanylate cyclase (GGDEF)-like protein/PAS domain S-box-containing protein
MRGKRPIRYLIVCGALLTAAVVASAGVTAFKLHESTLADNERELNNTALILAEHSDRALQTVELIHSSIQDRIETLGVTSRQDFEHRMSEQDMHLMLKNKISGLAQVAVACLTSVDGRLINFSRSWPSMDLNVADRDYIKALRSNTQLTAFVSSPLRNPETGQWTLYFARKFFAPSGEFVGIVGVGIDLGYFEQFFSSVALRQDAGIAIFRRDGVLLARYPHIDAMIGKDFSQGPLFQNLLSRSDHGTMQINSRIDGRDRLVAARTLGHYPLVLVAATTMSTALSGWYQQASLLIILTSLSVCAIALIAFLLLRQWMREQHKFQLRLEMQKARLDTALNNMTQGLVLFDSSERIVACNERYVEMYGLSSDVVKAGCTFRELIRHRSETGSFAGDADEYRAALMRDLALGEPTETAIKTPDGHHIRIVNKPVANGGWVATHDDVTERKLTEDRIAYLAHHDALTGLPNRMLFREQLEHSLKSVRRGQRLAVLYLDLDNFKTINDTLGHPVGDELLKIAAVRLRNCVRDTDIIARLGGDEFAIIQTNIEDPIDVIDLVTRIHEVLRTPCEADGHQLTADASIGISLAPDDATDPDKLLKNADLAMYGAKADGRGTYRFFELIMDARIKERRALEFDLREAITSGGLELYYQPIVNLRDDKISGCEALLRWEHPERGMISPAEFIPIAEDTGLIVALGEWVLRTACDEAATWPQDIKVAINVSPIQFRSGNFAQTVVNAFGRIATACKQVRIGDYRGGSHP